MSSYKQELLGRYLDESRTGKMGWNPFKAVRKVASAATNIATKAVTIPFSIASKSYNKITPKDLKKILRWTPEGLAIRAGVALAPGVKKPCLPPSNGLPRAWFSEERSTPCPS